MASIAFIGLGNMGGPMAANLVKAGHKVIAFDLVEASRQQAKADEHNRDQIDDRVLGKLAQRRRRSCHILGATGHPTLPPECAWRSTAPRL